MKVTRLDLDGVTLVELVVRGDQRGFFVERYQESRFRQHGLPTRTRTGQPLALRRAYCAACTTKRTRGQGKLVGVVRGRIWDVAVDMRPTRPTYGQQLASSRRPERPAAVGPAGFAHGFCVLGDEPADVLYKVDAAYNPAGEGGIRWDDVELGDRWPVRNPIVSARDKALPRSPSTARTPCFGAGPLPNRSW